jgi:hypothetical protein
MSTDPTGVAQLVVGVELAIVHLFNMLHHRGLVPRGDAIQSLQATIDGLPSNAPPGAAAVLRHIVQGLERQVDPPLALQAPATGLH